MLLSFLPSSSVSPPSLMVSRPSVRASNEDDCYPPSLPPLFPPLSFIVDYERTSEQATDRPNDRPDCSVYLASSPLSIEAIVLDFRQVSLQNLN